MRRALPGRALTLAGAAKEGATPSSAGGTPSSAGTAEKLGTHSSFELGFRLASYTLVGIGFLALGLSGQISAVVVAAGFLALPVAWWLVGRPGAVAAHRLAAVPPRLWTGLTLLLAGLAVGNVLLLGEEMIVAIVELLVAIQVIKLLSIRSDRDYFQLYAISFFQLLAAATLSESIGFAVSFLLYMLVATWTLLALHLREEVAAQPAGETLALRRLFTLPFAATTTLLTVGTLAVTLTIFFALPRVGRGFLQRASADPVKLSGFADTVRLGEIGEIKTDPTTVMRVRAPGPDDLVQPIRFWRGSAFDRYDGRTWSRSVVDKRQVGARADGWIQLETDPPQGQVVEQVVLLEPIDTPVLFAAGRPLAFQPVSNVGRWFQFVYRDGMGSLSAPWTPYTRMEYAVTVDLGRPTTEALRAAGAEYPQGMRRYLELPPLDPRVAALAASVTRGVWTPYDRALALEQHLRSAYDYSLSVSPTPGVPPLEDFLFNTKRGYCEYSATAMAILLRTLGIPSRMVSGFLRGEWNEYGGYYLVRQSEAHTWVEVYFPGQGWVPFDPTPPAGTALAPGGTLSSLARYVDAIRNRWNRYIVGYSLFDQLSAARSVQGGTRALAARVREGLSAATAKVVAAVRVVRHLEVPAVVVIPCLALLAILLLRGRAFVRRTAVGAYLERRRLNREILKLYTRATAAAAAHGVPRRPSQTAREHAGLVRARGLAGADGLESLARLYEAVRFGRHRATPDDVTAARAAAGRLGPATRNAAAGFRRAGGRRGPALDSRP